jgi:hypothetical protein
MAGSKPGKKKLPRSVEDLIAIEDRLDRMKGCFRQIREEMQKSGLASVDLACGTFLMFLDKLEPLAVSYAGEVASQVMIAQLERLKKKPSKPAAAGAAGSKSKLS